MMTTMNPEQRAALIALNLANKELRQAAGGYMTRKDYPFLASALLAVREGYAPNWNPNLFRACDDHAKELARRLKAENPAFDANRFLKDAGVRS